MELSKFTQACDSYTTALSSQSSATAAKKSAELSSLLRTTHQSCDQALSQLVDFIITSSSGGDDVAAEILEELWQARGALSKQQQASLKTELTTAKEQLHVAEQKASEAEDKLSLKLEQEEQAAKEAAAASGGKKKSGTSRTSGSASGDGGDLEGEDSIEFSEKSRHLLALSKASVAALETLNAELKVENSKLLAKLENSQQELKALSERTAALEIAAAEVVDAKSRAQAAELELEEMKRNQGQLTPRPKQEHHELRALLGEESKIEIALAALEEHCPVISIEELATLLVTEPPSPSSAQAPPAETSSPAAAGTAATSPVEPLVGQAAPDPTTTSSPAPIESVEESNQLPLPLPLPPPPPPPASRFSGLLVGVAPKSLSEALSRARGPTTSRYASLEVATAALRLECIALETELATHREAEQKREAARKRREEETQLEKKNAIQQYLDLLSSQGEETWKEQLIGMGQATDVPKIFRHSGKIRNKHMSKRDTEKLVKELWKERLVDPAVSAGRAGELVEFVGGYLQKKVGIAAAVIELGYNFLYGLWLYQWDADCELFLKILTGEIREEVYIAQSKLQFDLEELFALMDKAKGQASGIIPKEDLRTALGTFFRVGLPGGKTLARFDEVMQALDADQPTPTVEWKKIFEEDREFNQGEFAETLRDQFLQERIEFFAALEIALYEEANNEEECTKAQIIRAILDSDPECTEKAAGVAAGGVFGPGIESLSIKAVMKKLSRGMLRGGGGDLQVRGSLGGSNAVAGRKSASAKGSVSVKGRASSSTNSNAAAGAAGGKPGRCFVLLQIHTKDQHFSNPNIHFCFLFIAYFFFLQVSWRQHGSRTRLSGGLWKRCGKNGFEGRSMINLLLIVLGIKWHSTMVQIEFISVLKAASGMVERSKEFFWTTSFGLLTSFISE